MVIIKYFSSEEDKSAGSKNTGGRKHAFAEVYFNIIVSPTLFPSSNKGEVFVHFQSPTLAGWNSRKHKMNLKRYVNTKYETMFSKNSLQFHLFFLLLFLIFFVFCFLTF
jgi:hypothetical protein